MKYHQKFYYLYIIIRINLFYFIFLLFLSNCSSQKFQDKSSSSTQISQKTHMVFSSFKTDSKLSIYSDKFSKRGSLLILREGKLTPSAMYAEYILSSISPLSIERTKSTFQVEIPRFALSEKLYVGNYFYKDRMSAIEIEFERVYTRTRQGNDFEGLLESKNSLDYKESEIWEKLVFKTKRNDTLWKAEEWMIQNQKPILWRNYEEGAGLLSKVSFSEFHSPLGMIYSKIILPQDYLYIFGRDSNPIILYSFYDFEIVADLNAFLGKEENSPPSNPALLNKNSLPKLYLNKILNTNGN
jgi:hypothetical protein